MIGPTTAIAPLVKNHATAIPNVPCVGFAPHQQVSDEGGAIPAATTIVSVEETSEGICTLTISAEATANRVNDRLNGEASATLYDLSVESGAFEAGQTIEGPGIPLGTKLESCAPECGAAASSLTLSAKATKTTIGARIGAFSPCAEAASKACTTPVSEAAEVASGESGATFWGAAADGSRAVLSVGNLDTEQRDPARLRRRRRSRHRDRRAGARGAGDLSRREPHLLRLRRSAGGSQQRGR